MLQEDDIKLLRRYARPIYHLRAQLSGRKLVPFFGAGASLPLGLPNWGELVSRVAAHPEVRADSLTAGSQSQTSKVQLIFNHFKRKELEKQGGGIAETTLLERTVSMKWREIVHTCLYRDAKDVCAHPYLADFIAVIRGAPLTVNYNFDDSLQDLLDQNRDPVASETRGFETIWEPTVQFRYNNCVLYHPNGYLPRKLKTGPSPRLVFLEDSFADQLIDAQRGHYSTLLSHLQRFTGLLVGLSLEDPTLRHLLRQSAQSSPGHVHYYVAYSGCELPSQAKQQAVRDSNFNTYNLVTLFLMEDEFRSLGRLLVANDKDFAIAADEAKQPSSFVYYLSGAVGSGKTTSLGAFKSLNSYDEWLEEKPELLHKASDTLLPEERKIVDEWVNRQMRRRNLVISKDNYLLSIVDRSPLDPIAFSWDRRAARASELLELYAGSSAFGPCSGMVILLKGNSGVLHSRTIDRHKQGSVMYLDKLQENFETLWNMNGAQVAIVDTVDVTIPEVVKRVARIIHLDDYRTSDLARVAGGFAE